MSIRIKEALSTLANGIPLDPLPPPITHRDPSIPHAPKRNPAFRNKNDYILAIRNALRYFPRKYHSILLPEFSRELSDYGHIYMYRFRPRNYEMKGYPISLYPGQLTICKCIMIMIMNNLDYEIAQFPHELITYGGNGSVLSNWAQYHILMKYLCQLSDNQTLVMMSGHPLGIFPTLNNKNTPKLVISNGITIPNYSSKKDYSRMYGLGVSIYGQMTAGSYCYIGPQGIVHGTTITVLNAGRKYLGLQSLKNTGVVYVSSGLGGMSGAQPKATYIIGCIGIFAEVDIRAIEKRYKQGWVQEIISDLDILIGRIIELKQQKQSRSIAYHGNIVDLWCKFGEYTQKTGKLLCELGSDQTSLHNPFNGGYYPCQISFKQSQNMMVNNPIKFKNLVQKSLIKHVNAINILCKHGMKFWDYGNCFLLESQRAGADIMANKYKFKYPSYVEDIMGNIFSLGFGPFRWICTSRNPNDLIKTDNIAKNVLCNLRSNEKEQRVLEQLNDNIYWIENANKNKLVVGTEARILYANADARIKIALEMNAAINRGYITGPIVLSRDHHDVSGTDSPFRETSNISDGSKYCADMAIQNFVGDSFRGASWVALHNGGGVGFGEVINGGFGLVLDGTKQAEINAKNMLFWDVNNGIARRAWAGNDNANFQIKRAMKNNKNLIVTIRNDIDEKLIEKINIPSKL
eukprot:493203_1